MKHALHGSYGLGYWIPKQSNKAIINSLVFKPLRDIWVTLYITAHNLQGNYIVTVYQFCIYLSVWWTRCDEMKQLFGYLKELIL